MKRLLPQKIISGSFLKYWLNDKNFTNLIKNATTLLSGNMIAWVIGLFTLAITARILGPNEFGILILITTFVTLIGTFVSFQSWQTVIKYGADVIQEKDPSKFKQIIKFCTIIDFLTAIIGLIIAISVAIFFGNLFSINPQILHLTILFSVTLLFNVSGTPTGILRLFGEFRLITIQNIIASIIKFVGIVFVFLLLGANFLWIIYVWMITTIIGNLLLLFIGWNELKKHEYHSIFNEPLSQITVENPGILSFIISTNLTSSVRLGSKEVDIMIIGGILGVEAVGLYKIAKQIAAIPAMISDPLYQAIYPDLSKLWAKKDLLSFKKLMIRSSIFAGCGGLVLFVLFFLFGKFFIQMLFGSAYIAAFPVLILYLIGILIAIFGFPLQPAMLAMGKPNLSLLILLFSTFFYLFCLSLLLQPFGLIGAAISISIFYTIWSVIMVLIEMQHMTRKPFGDEL